MRGHQYDSETLNAKQIGKGYLFVTIILGPLILKQQITSALLDRKSESLIFYTSSVGQQSLWIV